jgi:hypothetical protein
LDGAVFVLYGNLLENADAASVPTFGLGGLHLALLRKEAGLVNVRRCKRDKTSEIGMESLWYSAYGAPFSIPFRFTMQRFIMPRHFKGDKIVDSYFKL